MTIQEHDSDPFTGLILTMIGLTWKIVKFGAIVIAFVFLGRK